MTFVNVIWGAQCGKSARWVLLVLAGLDRDEVALAGKMGLRALALGKTPGLSKTNASL
jgi:hypothetical protein